jgi:ribosomal protein L7/L12
VSLLVFITLLLALVSFMVTVLIIGLQNQARAKAKRARPHISDAGLRELLRQNRMDEAIELYQRFTGVDIFSARDAVAATQRDLRLSDAEAEMRRLLRLGDKASAIEAYQQVTGAPLAEALAAVEALEQKSAGKKP